MALATLLSSSFAPFIIVASLSLLNRPCYLAASDWVHTKSTWYGPQVGGGSDGGACGYQTAVRVAPFSSFTFAGGCSLFNDGKGCGACYQVECPKSNIHCSGNPITVVITDFCPDCASNHFDLSGTAFGALAINGQADLIRNAGFIQIQYNRIPCSYPGTPIKFIVDSGSNAYYFATNIRYVAGDGDLSLVEMKQGLTTDPWLPMQRSWGAVWKINSVGSALRPPFSFRLTTLTSGRTLIAPNVIPVG